MNEGTANNPPGQKAKVRIIDSVWTLVIGFLVVGPFILPLLWRNPRFTVKAKVIWSVLMIAVTLLLILYGVWFTNWMVETLLDGMI